jgi:hypothetical protein
MWVSRIRKTESCRAGKPGHFHDLRFRRDGAGLDQSLRRLGDVDGMVAHPFQVVGDLERRGEHPQVAGHGLLQRQKIDALLLDFHFHGIDHPVAGDHPAGLLDVALEQRLHRQAERRLRLPGHGEEPYLDVTQLVVEVAVNVDAHPNLPVI